MLNIIIDLPENLNCLQCVYKITIGDKYYYGSTHNIHNRIKCHIVTFNNRRCVNKKIKKQLKINNNVTFSVIYFNENMEKVVQMEDFLIKGNIYNKNSLNVNKSAYQNYRPILG